MAARPTESSQATIVLWSGPCTFLVCRISLPAVAWELVSVLAPRPSAHPTCCDHVTITRHPCVCACRRRGTCGHAFHLQCISKWLNSDNEQVRSRVFPWLLYRAKYAKQCYVVRATATHCTLASRDAASRRLRVRVRLPVRWWVWVRWRRRRRTAYGRRIGDMRTSSVVLLLGVHSGAQSAGVRGNSRGRKRAAEQIPQLVRAAYLSLHKNGINSLQGVHRKFSRTPIRGLACPSVYTFV